MKQLFITLCALVINIVAFGQDKLSLDENVRAGKLENGLTYYICHKENPGGHTSFRLLTHIGAYQEEEHEHGFAHFIEHMCLNGTKNFPGRSAIEYLENQGCRFGKHINAHTSHTATCYVLNNIPTTREGIIDSCLLILHDFSHYATLDPKEIDKERGIIIAESNEEPMSKAQMETYRYLFGGDNTIYHEITGVEEELRRFKAEDLAAFYHKWYQPDIQAVVVVGDIDVDAIEKKIKELFGTIPAPKNPTVKPAIKTPQQAEPVVALIEDSDSEDPYFVFLWKNRSTEKEQVGTKEILKFKNRDKIICETLKARTGNSSFKINKLYNGYNLFRCNCVSIEIYEDIQRMYRYGITDSELEHFKQIFIALAETSPAFETMTSNSKQAEEIATCFLNKESVVSIDYMIEVLKEFVNELTTKSINSRFKSLIDNGDFIVLCYVPDLKETSITVEKIKDYIEELNHSDIETPVEETQTDEPLLNENTIIPGKIKKEKEYIYGSTIWILENGAEVIFVPDTTSKGTICIDLEKEGGMSLLEAEEVPSCNPFVLKFINQERGLSKFGQKQLEKIMGTKLSVAESSISALSHNINIFSFSSNGIETAMQLLYLNINEPRFDNTEFQKGIRDAKINIDNQSLNKTIVKNEVFYNNSKHHDYYNFEEANIEDFEKAMRRLYGDVAGATIYITGDTDAETIKPLVEKYIASLPGGKKGKGFIDRKDGIVEGKIIAERNADMESPNSFVELVYTAKKTYNLKNNILCNALEQYLENLYIITLREDESKIYTPHVGVAHIHKPKPKIELHIAFDTESINVKLLTDLATKGVEDIATNGIPAEHLEIIKTSLRENFKKMTEGPLNAIGIVMQYHKHGFDLKKDYIKTIDEITSDDIKEFVKDMLKQGNFIQLTIHPEK